MAISVVDDEEDNLELLRQLLDSVGAHVRVASTAADTWLEFEARTPDVFVADIGLPNVDGCELLRRIRSKALETAMQIMPKTEITGSSR